MSNNEWKARGKVTQKMTRDGLVEQNLANGAVHSVSHGERDFSGHSETADCAGTQARTGPAHPQSFEMVFKGETAVSFGRSGNSAASAHPDGQISQKSPNLKVNIAQKPEKPSDGHNPQAVSSSDSKEESSGKSEQPQSSASGSPSISNVRQHGTKYQRRFLSDADKPTEPSKLQFTKGEPTPGSQPEAETRKALKLHQRAEKQDAKLTNAREQLPSGHRVRLKRESDEAGRAHHRLRFEKETTPQDARNPLASLAKGAAAAALMAAHGKIQEAERENVGVEAGHKMEQSAEALASQSARFLYRRAKSSPYRRVERLEHRAARSNVNYLYRKAVEENPALKSNPLSRMIQKRKIRQQYAKAARATKNGAKCTAKSTVSAAGKIKRLLKRFAGPHKKVLAAILAIIFILFFLVSLISSCSTMLSNGFQSILSTSYTATDTDINQAEAYYSGLEAGLQKQIDNAEKSHPGYDEYYYQVGTIGHDPHELISYLTAMYDNFTLDAVKPVLQQLFNQQYQLSFVPKTETRKRTVTITDPLIGKTTTNQESYTYKILTVNLNAADFSEIITASLSQAGVTDKYAAYLQTKGNRQYFASPFSFDWNSYVVAVNSDNSAQIDVSAGTQVLSMLDGTVTQAGGGTIVIEDGNGLRAVYTGCNTIGVHTGQTVKKSDGIGTSGVGFTISVSHEGTALNPILFILDPESNNGGGSEDLSGSVESNRQLVFQMAAQYGMQDYVNLILAVMQQESGGRGGDPMQAAEGPYNTKYPHKPNGITDPTYSIRCGIQELKASLQLAGCTSPTDTGTISLALQGYNFGSGFISWAKARGGYSEANAIVFSQMEAAKLGWSSYGDIKYVQHVLRYYHAS